MRQEFDYRKEIKEVLVSVAFILVPFILMPDLMSYLYRSENKFLFINLFFAWILFCFFLFSSNIAERFSHLILKDEGIELISPIMHVNIPWKNSRIIEIRSRYGRHFAIYSPDMVVKRTPLGDILPSYIEKMVARQGIPISKYLGNDLEKILEVLSAYPEFKNCP